MDCLMLRHSVQSYKFRYTEIQRIVIVPDMKSLMNLQIYSPHVLKANIIRSSFKIVEVWSTEKHKN